MPTAQHKSQRPRILPMRYRDNVPWPLAQCPPPSANLPNSTVDIEPYHQLPGPSKGGPPPSTVNHSAAGQVSPHFCTPINAFWLFWQYFSTSPPFYDPEEFIQFPDLCNGQGESDAFDGWPDLFETMKTTSDDAHFGPYPNQTSFLLGEWYWAMGHQKSLQDFQSLLNIIRHSDFHPEDIQTTQWQAINIQLGVNDFDGVHSSGSDDINSKGWVDDAGWRKSSITIPVPFHQWANHPGLKDFFVNHLYHHSLTKVIIEKLSHPDNNQFFHYKPFELLWQCQAGDEIHIHGELYTSPAFAEEHQALQVSPNEPGCDLQKVVIALMFLSNMTHLTQFGTAKLWLTYLMFGNDTKYHCCKPTCNLCHHVAYFLTVRGISFLPDVCHCWCDLSSQTHSKILWQSTWVEDPANPCLLTFIRRLCMPNGQSY